MSITTILKKMAFRQNKDSQLQSVVDKVVTVPQNQKNTMMQGQKKDNSIDLTAKEIEIVIMLLKQTVFPVKDIEPLYIALYKLQEQYKQLLND